MLFYAVREKFTCIYILFTSVYYFPQHRDVGLIQNPKLKPAGI